MAITLPLTGRGRGKAAGTGLYSRPDRMAAEMYEQIPQTLTLRELQFDVTEPGRRVETITVETTLSDPRALTHSALARIAGATKVPDPFFWRPRGGPN